MMTYDDIYLVSFSHDPDVLSMWNRYGKKAGYSLCFDTEVLRGQVESAADDIFPGQFEVLYAADVQQKLIHAELQNLATEYRKGNLLLGKVPEKDVRNSILRMLFSLKHPCYSDESESRYAFAIANPLGTCSKNYAEKTRFRVKAGRFYPFTEIKFDPRTVLKQVHLSPGLSLRDTEGIDMFLYEHVGGIPILESKLPYVDR
jgi:Protein of unknown function (DUF2971)